MIESLEQQITFGINKPLLREKTYHKTFALW